MCGICGEIKFDKNAPDRSVITKMMSQLEKRGPDFGAHFIDGSIGFGHRRLAIIDLTEKSNQPMIDRDLGLVIVFNGTIYNYKILKKELLEKGYRFFSEGDTEVILKAYHAWGEACVDKLNGMFAFAIWDTAKQQVFIARDRFGIKPLYYVKTDRFFRFASTMPVLLSVDGVDTSLDPIALHHQFTLHAVVPAPRTILKGVRKVVPGTSLTLRLNGEIKERCYWQLQAQRPALAKTEQEWEEEIHAALLSAVKKRKEISDVPVGVLLSGGLDSSLLVALLAEVNTKELLTFSIGFEDIGEERGSEFEYSDLVAQRYQTQHHKIRIPNQEVLRRLPEAVDNMAEPMVAQDAVAFYLLSEQVSKHVKVVQSGQGADEVFGGYFWYPRMEAESGTDIHRFKTHYFDRSHQDFLDMVTLPYHGEDYTSEELAQRLAQPGADTFIDKVFRLDTTTLIVDDPVKRVDNMTMAWGLEARVPFLDQELVELAMQMPPALKLRSEGKHILKSIAQKLLPREVIDRPKGYFPMPALKHIKGSFLEFMQDVLTSPSCQSRHLYNREYISKLLNNPEKYTTKINGSTLWHLALLEFWLQRHNIR